MNNRRGRGTTTRSFSWSLDNIEVLRKAVVLAGAEGLSSIIEQLVTEWVTQNEAALQNNNPIGLKYSSGTTTATKHWIDAIVEPQIEKLKQDISRIEDLELLKKISTRAWKINETTNFRSEVLRQIKRGRAIAGVAGGGSSK